jgi:hypothetical protein
MSKTRPDSDSEDFIPEFERGAELGSECAINAREGQSTDENLVLY